MATSKGPAEVISEASGGKNLFPAFSSTSKNQLTVFT
jgi:hypothetical protein